MASNLTSHFKNLFLFLLLIFLHLGCFIFSSNNNNTNNTTTTTHVRLPKRKKRSNLSYLSPKKAFSFSWDTIKRVFSTKNNNQTRHVTPASSPRVSNHSVFIQIEPDFDNPTRKRRSGSIPELPDALSENPFMPLRNDIFPCTICGEVFQKQSMLEQHQGIAHAISELRDGDSGKNIVWIIFKTGWVDPVKTPKVHRILKIHNSPKILARFEEYRELVKSRAARVSASRRDERCVADGNELLRFHCTTFVCDLGQNGNSSICNHGYCSSCGIIRVGFSPKLDGISTLSSSWRAHLSVPDDVEDEFAFMNVKRAMLVCRVIAGRVGCDPLFSASKEDPGYDSLVGRTGSGQGKLDDDELLVFNSKAVLPCFVIVYSVDSHNQVGSGRINIES